MAVDTSAVRISKQAGNSILLAFDFSFKIFAKTDLACYKVSAAGVYTLGVVDVDYTVSFDIAASTGTVTWSVAPVTGGFSVIIGNALPMTQTATIPREGPTPAATQKNMVDKLTLLVQQLSERVDRALLQPLTPVNPTALSIEAPVASRIVAWDSDADTLVNTSKTLSTFQTDVDNTAANAAASAASASASATSATAAASSASAASTSASNASTSASAAATSAAAAATSYSNVQATIATATAAAIVTATAAASTSATAAAASAAAASTSASNASTSASGAATSASAASTSASAAASSASSASSSASAAASSASAAATSATDAANSASSALSSASTATTQASNASSSATSASSSATAAAASAALAATYNAIAYTNTATVAARIANPSVVTINYATLEDQIDIYIPTASRWRTIG